ncbi:MAG TPA: 3D domain-containing protein [Kofleriaceae bacterium]|nr:3D domain-containing protein [Kofleriaceae bacterium]
MTTAIGCEASDGYAEGSCGSIAWRPSRDGALAAIASALGSSVRFVADVIDRIVNGIRAVGQVAPLVIGLGCQSTHDVVPASEPLAARTPAPPVSEPTEPGPRPLGKFTITFYYVIGEDEITSKPVLVAANDNRAGSGEDADLTAITPDLVTLYAGGGACEPIAEVSKEFASQLAIQGTGKLHDGRVLNIWGACNCKHTPCFKVTRAQWGTAGSGRPLQPFRTVAVDPKVVKIGSLLYVPLLEGRTMPGRPPWGGYVHDGCVMADDTGGHISGNRLDLFVGRKGYFLGLSGSGGSHAWARHVPVFDGKGICERKGRHVGRKTASI